MLFSRDVDLLAEARRRLVEGRSFATVIYAPQTTVSIGQCVADLELIAQAATEEEAFNQIHFLPL